MNNYEKQANDFLLKTNTIINVAYSHYGKHFEGDNDRRDVYDVTITRGSRLFSFKFGQSTFHTGEYIGHLHLCLNSVYKKNVFTEEEARKMRPYDKLHLGVRKNPDFKIPTNYDILACLQKSEVGSLEDFCGDFGYDPDSKTADRVYHAVKEEWMNVCMIWNDSEIEELQEIQ